MNEKERLDLAALISEQTGAVVLMETDPRPCDMCGTVDELRPYGPNGENVCFDCGMKDEAAVDRAFARRFA